MIAEELRPYLVSEDDGEKKKTPKKPETADANADSKSDPKATPGAGSKRQKDAMPVGTNPADTDGMDDSDPGPMDPEEADDADEDEADALDQDGSGAEPTGAVNSELSGKTVQAITIEPKSKVLPGAKEVILTFNETTDSLRILVTGTGQVKFFYRGQLHDLP